MPRYIDAEKLCELARNHINKSVDCNDIMRFPTADVQEVRHGVWEVACEIVNDERWYRIFCSNCSMLSIVKYDYCPHCGAKMGEEEQE